MSSNDHNMQQDFLPTTTLELARTLIKRESITPEDAGCQSLIGQNLATCGFKAHDYSQAGVINTLFSHQAEGIEQGSHLMFLGHTDVVPPGPESEWHSPAFEPTEREGYLFGRGAADMKGAVAAMMTAIGAFVKHHTQHVGRVSLLLTSDEEGVAEHGVRAVMPRLVEDQLLPDYCLVGEPSSLEQLGDNIRVGRRGSIQGVLRCYGVQGHTAYADKQDNPVHRVLTALSAIANESFDNGDEHFPETLLHISNIQAGTGATNVTPGMLEVKFNIRNSPASPADLVHQRIVELLEANDCGAYELDWHISGEPFITRQGALLGAVQQAVKRVAGLTPVCDTGGGTSDGRFFAAEQVQVVELGLINRTIHQVNENTLITDLDRLHSMYYDICRQLLIE